MNDDVAMLSYFPWAITAPRADWVPSDDTTYPKGTYPEIEAVYQSQGIIDYRVDRNLVSANDRAGLLETLFSSEASGCGAWQVFKDEPPGVVYNHWASAWAPSDSDPAYIGLSMQKPHKITEVRLYPRTDYNIFPKRAKLQASDDGVDWVDLTDELALTNGETTIEIPADRQVAASLVRLEIYESYYSKYAGISRMRFFAEGVNSPIIAHMHVNGAVKVLDMGGQRKMPGMTEWCLRMGETVSA